VPEASHLDIILYSRSQLLQEYAAMPSKTGGEAAEPQQLLPDVPWGIISIKVSWPAGRCYVMLGCKLLALPAGACLRISIAGKLVCACYCDGHPAPAGHIAAGGAEHLAPGVDYAYMFTFSTSSSSLQQKHPVSPWQPPSMPQQGALLEPTHPNPPACTPCIPFARHMQAQDEPYETPMQPITMMRNALGREEGGSGVALSRQAYEAAVDYWQGHAAIVAGEEPSGE
jgi:hypothetical protein